ncbi:MAG TPA: hypothetical protein VHN11_12720, partial [Xanthobacteraceae bacterium]|nr:hypothetical protein [Xanthobacteraceae bacterium]
MRQCNNWTFFLGRLVLAISLIGVFAVCTPLRASTDEDALIARNLADMLRAARQVISSNQGRINDPNIGDKGLTGHVVLEQAIEIFKKTTGTDPAT